MEVDVSGKRMEVLLDANTIAARVKELGAAIARDYQDKDLVLITVLKGSIIFAADLARAINLPLTMEFMGLSSYGDDTKSTGVVRVTLDLSKPIEGKHVLIVEDIVDTGLTMQYLLRNMKTRNPASVGVCTLLHKPARQTVDVPLDYVGFTIDDQYESEIF